METVNVNSRTACLIGAGIGLIASIILMFGHFWTVQNYSGTYGQGYELCQTINWASVAEPADFSDLSGVDVSQYCSSASNGYYALRASELLFVVSVLGFLGVWRRPSFRVRVTSSNQTGETS